MNTTRYSAGLRVSEYLLEQPLGQGTFGEVWQARHHVWDKERVAIKLPTEPEYVRFLQREGLVVHGLRHENIVRVMGFDPYAETPYLVMELVDGPSVRDVLAENKSGLPLEAVYAILRGLLQGLAFAHQANTIHRDLKPGNVLLNLAGRPIATVTPADVKLTDFGLGVPNEDALRSMVAQSMSIERDAQSTAVAGTLAYMAPEIRDGQQPASRRSDLYAVGVILFELLTGERPAGAELPSTLRPDTPVRLDRVFQRLYARLDNRYESAAAVLDDLGSGEPAWDGDDEALPPLPGEPTAPRANRPVHDCPHCSAPCELDDQFCTHCGHQLTRLVRRCATCGGYPGPQDRYCIFCGSALAARE